MNTILYIQKQSPFISRILMLSKFKGVAICLSMVLIFVVLGYSSAYASEFRITGGISSYITINEEYLQNYDHLNVLNSPNLQQEITFDAYRILTGTAPQYSIVTLFIVVNTDDIVYEAPLLHLSSVTVGYSGVFSIDIPLIEGYNTILISFNDPSYYYTSVSYNHMVVAAKIRRMPEILLDELSLSTPRLPGYNLY